MLAPQPVQAGLDLTQAIQILDKLTSSEEHFDTMKSTCKSLASTWLLATFAGMGFALTQKFEFAIATELITFGISVAGAIGIFLIWVLDLLVYHRLLDASFIEALKLEQRFAQLPQVRHGMIAALPDGQTPHHEQWFYVGCLVAPVVFSGPLFIRWCMATSPQAAIGAAVLLVCITACVVGLMRRNSPNPALPMARLRRLAGVEEGGGA
ncbi:MAG: hypothetical protein EPO01_03480 [Aquabacterium sp.]|nr:MAG: hypothetical protein EPO01_03480 [Aquabacterium sp.]